MPTLYWCPHQVLKATVAPELYRTILRVYDRHVTKSVRNRVKGWSKKNSLKNIRQGDQLLLKKMFLKFLILRYLLLYFLELGLMFVGSVDNFGRSDDDKI